jgi:hypothetical protein
MYKIKSNKRVRPTNHTAIRTHASDYNSECDIFSLRPFEDLKNIKDVCLHMTNIYAWCTANTFSQHNTNEKHRIHLAARWKEIVTFLCRNMHHLRDVGELQEARGLNMLVTGFVCVASIIVFLGLRDDLEPSSIPSLVKQGAYGGLHKTHKLVGFWTSFNTLRDRWCSLDPINASERNEARRYLISLLYCAAPYLVLTSDDNESFNDEFQKLVENYGDNVFGASKRFLLETCTGFAIMFRSLYVVDVIMERKITVHVALPNKLNGSKIITKGSPAACLHCGADVICTCSPTMDSMSTMHGFMEDPVLSTKIGDWIARLLKNSVSQDDIVEWISIQYALHRIWPGELDVHAATLNMKPFSAAFLPEIMITTTRSSYVSKAFVMKDKEAREFCFNTTRSLPMFLKMMKIFDGYMAEMHSIRWMDLVYVREDEVSSAKISVHTTNPRIWRVMNAYFVENNDGCILHTKCPAIAVALWSLFLREYEDAFFDGKAYKSLEGFEDFRKETGILASTLYGAFESIYN